MQPFIAPLNLDEVSPEIQQIYQDYETHLGIVPPLIKILARRLPFAQMVLQLRLAENAVSDTISLSDHFLIAARMAVLSHSPYAMRSAQERNEMYRAMADTKLQALLQNRVDSELFTDRELCIVDLVTKVHTGTLDQRAWQHAQTYFADTELLDLIVIACNHIWLATFSRAVGLTSSDMVNLSDPAPAG